MTIEVGLMLLESLCWSPQSSSKKGYRIPSEGLALVLKDYFNSCENQASLKEYSEEVIEQTGATPEHLAREFHVDEKDLKGLLQ